MKKTSAHLYKGTVGLTKTAGFFKTIDAEIKNLNRGLNMTAFERGFIEKCAQHGFDGRELAKKAMWYDIEDIKGNNSLAGDLWYQLVSDADDLVQNNNGDTYADVHAAVGKYVNRHDMERIHDAIESAQGDSNSNAWFKGLLGGADLDKEDVSKLVKDKGALQSILNATGLLESDGGLDRENLNNIDSSLQRYARDAADLNSPYEIASAVPAILSAGATGGISPFPFIRTLYQGLDLNPEGTVTNLDKSLGRTS